MSKTEHDDVTGIETTGHEWDGIRELNNPLPRWWLWTFYATVLFAIGYMIYYPSIPLIEGSTMGISGETNRSILKEEMAAIERQNAGLREQLKTTPLADIEKNEPLFRYALAGGSSLFKVNCSQCHGSGAQGAPGYPNLNDDDWLWGGDLQTIYLSINHGIRNEEDDDARTSLMPAFKGVLEPQQIRDVSQYVISISGRKADSATAQRGKAIYDENCASCHGDKGQGLREFGAPKLTDALWLYGMSAAEITTQVEKPQHGVMPAWGERLGEAAVKQLALYVYSLGGGEKTEPAE
ncbi:MAG: cytochrome-c oxidase, cbb3-type subunit III [Hyphomicrobiaceae bacterium]